MIYLAGIFILLGSLLLLITFFQEAKRHQEKIVNKKSFQEKVVSNQDFKKRKTYSVFTSSPNKSNSERDMKIRKERELSSKEEANLTDQSPVLERIFANDIEYAELVQEEEETTHSKPQVETQQIIQVKGILFLDYARKIPETLKKNSLEKWKEGTFLHFKRIGSTELQEDAGIIQFIAPNQIIQKLSLEEVEQILFYKNTFTLIPQNPALPIAVFFSNEVDKFKEYVSKRYSSIENYVKQ